MVNIKEMARMEMIKEMILKEMIRLFIEKGFNDKVERNKTKDLGSRFL